MAVKRKRRAAPDDRFHVAGAAPRKLFLGTPLRVLDHGTHRPILFQLEEADGAQVGQWVVKPSCNFPDGPSVLLHELAAARCARALEC